MITNDYVPGMTVSTAKMINSLIKLFYWKHRSKQRLVTLVRHEHSTTEDYTGFSIDCKHCCKQSVLVCCTACDLTHLFIKDIKVMK